MWILLNLKTDIQFINQTSRGLLPPLILRFEVLPTANLVSSTEFFSGGYREEVTSCVEMIYLRILSGSRASSSFLLELF
uniref:Uncharacterized protein n=1 Tax=Salix viminalis TaxID=40686 RepID=A0A6N2MTJ3_SALVM